MKVILASASPRRRQLLEWAGVPVEVRPSAIDEVRHPGEGPVAWALRLAVEKAGAVAAPDLVVVAADTVVHIGGRHFDKPVDRAEAAAHLHALSGRWHEVTTAVCVVAPAGRTTWSVSTSVRFRALETAEIDAYVATGEADDKAGAYGIQGRAGSFVAELRGDWTNVMGLPLEDTLAVLVRAGAR